MAKLIFYVPFSHSPSKGGDLRDNAKDISTATTDGFKIKTSQILSIKVVFKGNEQDVDNKVDDGDFICVNAHGGPGGYKDVTDNLGEETKIGVLVANLDKLCAEKAKACYFFVCYSAENKHIAKVWKDKHKDQDVYGSHSFAQGGVIMKLKSGKIKSSIFDDANGQLMEVT